MTAPLFLVRGDPTPEELAAVLAVLLARPSAAAAPQKPPRRRLWAAPALRAPLSPGPGAWRAAALPR